MHTLATTWPAPTDRSQVPISCPEGLLKTHRIAMTGGIFCARRPCSPLHHRAYCFQPSTFYPLRQQAFRLLPLPKLASISPHAPP